MQVIIQHRLKNVPTDLTIHEVQEPEELAKAVFARDNLCNHGVFIHMSNDTFEALGGYNLDGINVVTVYDVNGEYLLPVIMQATL